jgi:hypothetical protein
MAREDGMKNDQDKNLDKVTNQTWYNTEDIVLIKKTLGESATLQKVTEAGNTTTIPLIVSNFPEAATMASTHITVANQITSIGTSLTKNSIIHTNLTNTNTLGFVPPTAPRTQVFQDDDGVVALTKNLDTRTHWVGAWATGEYTINQQVFDTGYLAIANKTTQERPAPQPIGEPYNIFDGTLIPNNVSAKQVIFGTRYSPTKNEYIIGYRIETVVGNHYTVTSITDPSGPTPILNALIAFTASKTGWVNINIEGELVNAGATFDVIAIVNEPDPTPTTFAYDWNYKTPNNISIPVSGEIQQSNNLPDSLLISKLDNSLIDRNGDLSTITVGDFIEALGIRWAVQSVTPQTTYYNFGISPAIQSSPDGVTTFTFETVTATPITYGREVDYYLPTAEVSGLYGVDIPYIDIVPDDNAYGIDLIVQDLSISTDWDIQASLGSVASVPTTDALGLENNITVAKSGGDFTTLKDALDSITDSSPTQRYSIQVSAGIYTEDNPIQAKEYVAVTGTGDLQTTRFVAGNPNADLLIMANLFTIQRVALWGVSGATNYAVRQDVAGSTSVTRVIFGECTNGILVNHPNTQLVANDIAVFNPTVTLIRGAYCQAGIFNVYSMNANAGTLGTMVEITGVNSSAVLNNINAAISTLTTGISIKDLARVDVNSAKLIGMGTGIEVEGGSHTHLLGVRIEDATNDGVRINNNGGAITVLTVQSTIVENSIGFDFNLLSSTCIVSGNASTSINKINFVAGARMYGTVLDLEEDDEGINIIGELHVGLPEQGTEAVFGEGDSYTRGMMVYSETPGGVFTDRSVEARSASASSFTFDGVVAENAIYIASSLSGIDVLAYHGIKTKVLTAAVKNGGSIIIEYWNGAAWIEVNGMEVDSSGGYYPHANNYFQATGSHHIRYNSGLAIDGWTKNDPITPALGTDYFWTRFRIVTTITTAPIFEQFKLHTSRFETNSDGWIEYFGKARPIGVLPWDLGLAEAANSSPGNQDIFLSDNLGVGRVENLFTNAATDRIGFNSYLPLDLDTSSPVSVRFSVITDDASEGNLDWVIRWGYSNDTLNVYPTTATAPTVGVNEQSIASSLPAPLVAYIQKTYEFSLDISTMVSRREGGFGDILWVSIERTSGDTHDGEVAMINFQAFYTKWCEGGHI